MSVEDLLNKFNTYKQVNDISKNQIFNQLSLYIYYLESEKTNPDLYLLAKLLDDDNYNRLVDHYVNGTKLKIPSRIEKSKCDILAICFYFREILGFEWSKIVDIFKEQDIKISPISIGTRLSFIKNRIVSDLESLVDTLSEDDYDDIKSKIKNE